MDNAILDRLKTLKKGERAEVENPRLEEWKPIEEVIRQAREKFLADEDLGLEDVIGEIADSLAGLIKPTEEEENEAIVEGIAKTRFRKLSTIDEEE